jgi:RNA polymerase sigma factor (sigma-70 family)
MNITTTDRELIERVKDWWEDEGWREFYGRYAPAIEAHARRSGLSPEEAQDVVQTTMLKVATYIPKFEYDRTVCKFRTWLNQIVNQRIIAIWHERRKFHLPEDVRVELGSLVGGNVNPREDPVAQCELEHGMLQVCLARVRVAVKPKHWQIFEANTIGRLSAREVAQRYDTTVANVWVIHHRLIRRLKAEWQALLNEPFEASPRFGRR